FFSIFFFQAEDGIRDRNVTGVQTCALPIYVLHPLREGASGGDAVLHREQLCRKRRRYPAPALFPQPRLSVYHVAGGGGDPVCHRSEERRVGIESMSGWDGCRERNID